MIPIRLSSQFYLRKAWAYAKTGIPERVSIDNVPGRWSRQSQVGLVHGLLGCDQSHILRIGFPGTRPSHLVCGNKLDIIRDTSFGGTEDIYRDGIWHKMGGFGQ